MDDENKSPPASDTLSSPYTTATEAHGIEHTTPVATPGLSFTPGLQEVPNSTAPSMADGSAVAHVWGPGQAAVDPIAAGLDVSARVPTRAENRVITQTGELGAGPRPVTYVEKGLDVPQSAPSDGSQVRAQSDAKAAEAPGPSGHSEA